MDGLTTLILKLPREGKTTGEASLNFLSSLLGINKTGRFAKIFRKNLRPISLEIVLNSTQIHFQITCSEDLADFIGTQLKSGYPLVNISKGEPTRINNFSDLGKLGLTSGSYYPIKTYSAFDEVDPLSSLLAVLAGAKANDMALIQFAMEGVTSSWQKNAEIYASRGVKKEDGTYIARTDANVIKEKTKHPGFKVSIRIATNNPHLTSELAQSFSTYTRPDGNSFKFRRPVSFRKALFIKDFNDRIVTDNQILNIEELATLWHLPNEKVKTMGILWQAKVLSEAPENLPVSEGKDGDQRSRVNFFAKTFFKNKEAIFGIKDPDRRRHVWAIGKTGSGKSTLIANMVIDDLKKGKGVCIIDPHGDLVDAILDFVPKDRINDVVYFNPADKNYPIVMNPLEVSNKEEAELVVSGIISIFSKVFGEHWGPRIEYILRNCLLTLAELPDATLEGVLMLLTNPRFRDELVKKLKDPVIKSFWEDEYKNMPPVLQKEAISPILNKVGRFVTSPLIRSVISSPKSSVRIDDIMNSGKILLVNLSQGKLGEDNAALLGAMIITKIQLASMHRVNVSESERRDFYLYVDEFQNFATNSFIKILSEARKYHLNLMLANQYMAQIPIDVQKAILGNAGTMISFGVGAEDARILTKEYGEVFKENDLVGLQNFQIAIRLMVDGYSQRPFLATTLPLPASKNQNKETVIKVSRERWARKIKKAS